MNEERQAETKSVNPDSGDAYWLDTNLEDMTGEQWEALCDRCGKCCLVKFQDKDKEEDLFFTNISCRELDCSTGTCMSYAKRTEVVPTCFPINMEKLPEIITWLPASCAYKRLYEGKSLPGWHPLLNEGSYVPMSENGHSCVDKAVNETDLYGENVKDYGADWINSE